MREWIHNLTRYLLGEAYPFIGGPLNGHKMRLDRPRYLYSDVVKGKECVHIYRFATLRLSNDSSLQAFVSEKLDSQKAVALWESAHVSCRNKGS